MQYTAYNDVMNGEKKVFPIVHNLQEYVRMMSARMMREAQEEAARREAIGPQISDPALVRALQQYAAANSGKEINEEDDAFGVLDLTDPENYFAKMQRISMQMGQQEPETKTQSQIEAEKANGEKEKTKNSKTPSRRQAVEQKTESRSQDSGQEKDNKEPEREADGPAPSAGENMQQVQAETVRENVGKDINSTRGEKTMGKEEKSAKAMNADKSSMKAEKNTKSADLKGRSTNTKDREEQEQETKKEKTEQFNKKDIAKSPEKEAIDNSIRPDGKDLSKKTAEQTLKKTVVRGALVEDFMKALSSVRRPESMEQNNEMRAPDTRGMRFREAQAREAARADTPQVDAKTPEVSKDTHTAGRDTVQERQTMRTHERNSAAERNAPQKAVKELSEANPRRDVFTTLAVAKDMVVAGSMMKEAAMFTHTFDRPVQFKLGSNVLSFAKEGVGDEASTFALMNGKKIGGDEATKFFMDLNKSLGPEKMNDIMGQLKMASRDPYQGRTQELLSQITPQEEEFKKTQNIMRN